jgi:hypothetical protein
MKKTAACWFLSFWYPTFTLDPRFSIWITDWQWLWSYTSSSWIGCVDEEEMKCVALSTLGFTNRVRFGSLTSWITFYQNFSSMPGKLSQNRTCLCRSYHSTTHNLLYCQKPTFFGLHNQHCHHLPLSDWVLPHVKSRERQTFFLWKKQCVQNGNFIVKALDRLLL